MKAFDLLPPFGSPSKGTIPLPTALSGKKRRPFDLLGLPGGHFRQDTYDQALTF
jgi:hypothetical protein